MRVALPSTLPLTRVAELLALTGAETGGAGRGAAPITQEGEQESEAGEIDQSFDVS